jgi:BirA family biotin operon repressor/biotin-[acetyl-CoA-carboxylase] ligase
MKYNILHFKTLPSTNDKLMELLLQGCEEGTVVAALKQTSGRGQQGARWESEEGMNLTFSVGLHPTFLPAECMFYLSKAVSLGVVDYLKKEKIEAAIKWPNDIYVGDEKIAGMLIEQRISGELISQSAVGIGLNVNQKEFAHAPNATSMLRCDGKERDIASALNELVSCILVRYDGLRSSSSNIDADYMRHLYRADGRYYPFARKGADGEKGELFTAKILEVRPNGELMLERKDDANFSEEAFWFKEVELVL